MTVASLGIQINSAPVEKLVADLDKVPPASDKAERAVTKFGRSSSASLKFFSDVIERMDTQINVLRNIETRVTGLERVMMTYNQTASKTAQANKAVEAATETMTAATQRAVTAQKQLNVVQIDARQNHVVAVSVTNEMTAAMTRERSQVLASTAAIRDRNVALKQANDNNARFRRQNLTYQVFDIGQTAAMGMNPAMIAAQQGPQIAQLYAGAGGLKTALTDVGSMAGGVATRLWPVALAAAAGAAAVRDMQDNIREATGKSQTFGDVASTAFKTVAGDIKDLLQPAIDGVGSVAGYAFEKLSSAAVDIAELVINSFRAAFEDIKLVWNQFPNVIGAAVVGGLNVVMGALDTMVNRAIGAINNLTNSAARALAAIGQPLSPETFNSLIIGPADLKGIGDPYSGLLEQGVTDRNAAIERIMSDQPIRRYVKSVTDRVGSELGSGLPGVGSGSSAIPIPQLRGIDDNPGDVDFMRDQQKSNDIRMRQMRDSVAVIGQTTRETEALRFQQEALNDAFRQNIELSPTQRAAIKGQADEYGRLAAQQAALTQIEGQRDQVEIGRAELANINLIGPARERAMDTAQAEIDIRKLGIELYGQEANAIRANVAVLADLREAKERANLNRDLAFEAEQMGRSTREAAIAQRLRGTGIGTDSPEADLMRRMQSVDDLRDSATGFFSAIKDGVMEGGDIGRNIMRKIGDAMLDEADKLLDNVIQTLVRALIPAPAAPGLAPGAGSAFAPTLNGFANMIFGGGANDNYAPGAVTRAPLGVAAYRDAIASIESAGSGDYSAIGPTNATMGRALGRYQIMEANVGPWSQAALGKSLTPSQFMANPGAQDAIFDHRFGGYVQKYGEQGAAQAWFGGPGSVGKTGRSDVLGTTVGGYGERFTAALEKMQGQADTATTALDKMTTGTVSAGEGLGQLGNTLANAFPASPSSGGGGGIGGFLGSLFGGFGAMGDGKGFGNSSFGAASLISPGAANFLNGGGSAFTFSDGGYTGDGGVYDPAGMVHKGEVVWSQRDIAGAGGVSNVERMRKSGGRGGAAPGMTYAPVSHITIGDNAGVTKADVEAIVQDNNKRQAEAFEKKQANAWRFSQ